MVEYRACMVAGTRKLSSIGKRLAAEADTAMTAALTHLWEKEAERSSIAIQKEIDEQY